MSEPSSGKVGLACAGGAIGGAIYEIGVLFALQEAIEGLDLNRLDVYVGVSSGAVVASTLANGITPQEMSRAAVAQSEPELNLQPEVIFQPAVEEYVRRLRALPATVLDAVADYLRRPLDLSPMGTLKRLGTLVPAGIFNNDPLERYLARIFAEPGRTNDFRVLDARLFVVATELDTAHLACFGAEQTHVPISKAVQASTALPVFYCPVEIDGRHYIDGVARRTVHASVALEHGVDLLFCVNPIVPVDTRSGRRMDALTERTLAAYGLPTVLEQTFRTLVYSRMRTGFKRYAHQFPGADLLLIEPLFEETEMFFANMFSFTNRRTVCEHGYRTARSFLRTHAARVGPVLERHGMRLRRHVLDDPSRRLYTGPHAGGGRQRPGVTGHARETLDRLDAVLDRLARRDGVEPSPAADG